jgi:hypothetical protein
MALEKKLRILQVLPDELLLLVSSMPREVIIGDAFAAHAFKLLFNMLDEHQVYIYSIVCNLVKASLCLGSSMKEAEDSGGSS